MSKDICSYFEQVILDKISKKKSKHAKTPTHQGQMLVDEMAVEQARFPKDIILLNETREVSEALIDDLYKLIVIHFINVTMFKSKLIS